MWSAVCEYETRCGVVFFRGFISSWWDDWALWCEEGRLANIYIISLVSHFIQYEWVDIYEREGLVSLAPDVALFNLGIILIVSTAAVAAWEDRRGWQRHCVRPRHRICWYFHYRISLNIDFLITKCLAMSAQLHLCLFHRLQYWLQKNSLHQRNRDIKI